MALCPDSAGSGWETKTGSLARELGKICSAEDTGQEPFCHRPAHYECSHNPVSVSGADITLPLP